MAEVKIRDLSEHVVAFYRRRAASHGVSLEEELRRTLAEVQVETRRRLLEHIDAHRDELHGKYGIMPDSTPGVRAERDGEAGT
jgi:plasmid stability protein